MPGITALIQVTHLSHPPPLSICVSNLQFSSRTQLHWLWSLITTKLDKLSHRRPFRTDRTGINRDRIELHGRGIETPHILEREFRKYLLEPMQWSTSYFAINRILNQLQFLEEASFQSMILKTGQS